MRWRAVVRSVGIVVAATLALVPVAALADSKTIALKCGMTLSKDTDIHLTKNLSCKSSYGVRVLRKSSASDKLITIRVDLQGHTLRGSGTSWDYPTSGITAVGAGRVALEVRNGRVENWTFGIVGEADITVRNLKVTGNAWGLSCGNPRDGDIYNDSRCDIAASYFSRNEYLGMIANNAARIDHSRFTHNNNGAMVRHTATFDHATFADDGGIYVFPGATQIDVVDSSFTKSQYGIMSYGRTHVKRGQFTNNYVAAEIRDGTVEESTFVDNDIALLSTEDEASPTCLHVRRLIFQGNANKIIGILC